MFRAPVASIWNWAKAAGPGPEILGHSVEGTLGDKRGGKDLAVPWDELQRGAGGKFHEERVAILLHCRPCRRLDW